MSTIPTSLTEKQFNEHILPYTSRAKRGFESKIPLYKLFNYTLYRLHMGCQYFPHRIIILLFSNPSKLETEYYFCREFCHRLIYSEG